MTRRRWALLLIPVAGCLAMLALPPFDEYAALDRIGTPVDSSLPAGGAAYEEAGIFRV